MAKGQAGGKTGSIVVSALWLRPRVDRAPGHGAAWASFGSGSEVQVRPDGRALKEHAHTTRLSTTYRTARSWPWPCRKND